MGTNKFLGLDKVEKSTSEPIFIDKEVRQIHASIRGSIIEKENGQLVGTGQFKKVPQTS